MTFLGGFASAFGFLNGVIFDIGVKCLHHNATVLLYSIWERKKVFIPYFVNITWFVSMIFLRFIKAYLILPKAVLILTSVASAISWKLILE